MTSSLERPQYPPADRLDLVDDLHGVAVADPYRWLEDPADPRTEAWSAAQAALYTQVSDTWPGTGAVTDTVRALLRTGSVGAPTWRGSRMFVTRREPDAEHPVLTVTEDGVTRVLVDPIAWDPSGTTTMDGWSPSREGDLVAVQLSEGGTEESTLRVLDVATGEVVDGPIDRTRYSPVAWLPRVPAGGTDATDGPGGSTRFYYVRRLPPGDLPDNERQYHRRVLLHTVGTSTDDDVLIFGADQPMTTYFGAWTRTDGRWLVLSASNGTAPRSDVWLADLGADHADADTPALRAVAVGLDAQHAVWVGRDDRLYAFTDLDAPRGRLCVADPAEPEVDHWRDLITEDDEAVLADVAVLDRTPGGGDVLAVLRTRHGITELALHDAISGDPLPDCPPLPGLGSAGGLHTRPGGGSEAWLTYTDDVTPTRVLRLDVAATTPSDLATLDVWALPPGEPPAGPAISSRQISYLSADGTTVRMVVLARTDSLDTTGHPVTPSPTVLYGYGGFGISLTPGYSSTVLAWVRAGGVWATAQLRGGGEEGEAWHRDGMLGAKQNVFDDFLAAADTLVSGGWTTPGQLAVSGGSNGGLLVGAALTQRPAAFAAVLCSAPLLDMVRYELHGLGATWNEEYGTAADPDQFAWLHAYSPYHRVVSGTAYPAVLFTVFGSDTRVDPLHARKLCAALQHATTRTIDEAPILIRAEAEVGHGARSLSRGVALSAQGLAFLAARTGLTW